MVIEPSCLLLTACFQPLTVLIFIKKINLSRTFAITKRSTDVVTLREERFKNHRIHEKYTHMPTIVSLNGSSRLILFPLLCPSLSNSSTRIYVGRNATIAHHREHKKKNTHTGHTTFTTKFDIVSLSTESSIHLSSFLAALYYHANLSLFLS